MTTSLVPSKEPTDPSDSELIVQVRAGSVRAQEVLYARHHDAALGVAYRHSNSAYEAEDLASEGFARVFAVLRTDKGPDAFFRAYLCTTVSRLAFAYNNKEKRQALTADFTTFDAGDEYSDPVVNQFETGVVGGAFRSLPERWQAVLWYTEIDGLKPAAIAPMLGLSPNAVSALAVRAREGLRQAYLQGHVGASAGDGCQGCSSQLGAYARGGLSARNESKVEEHLNECPKCTAILVQVNDVGASMRGVIAPLFLGGITALGIPAAIASTSAGGTGIASAAGSAAAETGTAAAGTGSSISGSTLWTGLGAAIGANAAAVAVTAVAMAAVVAGVAIGVNETGGSGGAALGDEAVHLSAPPGEPGFDGEVMIPVDLVDRFHEPQIMPVASESSQGFPGVGGGRSERLGAAPAFGGLNLFLPRGNERQGGDEANGAPEEPAPGKRTPATSPTDPTGPVLEPTASRTPDEVDPSHVAPTEPTVEPWAGPTEPIQVVPDPTPTDPTVDPTEPAVQPTPIDPSVVPTEPTMEPTEPSEPTPVEPDPTQTDPTVDPPEPIEPTAEPTEPTAPPSTSERISVEAVVEGYEVRVDARGFGDGGSVKIRFERLAGEGAYAVFRDRGAGCSEPTMNSAVVSYSCSGPGAGRDSFSVEGTPAPGTELIVRVTLADKQGNQTQADLVFK